MFTVYRKATNCYKIFIKKSLIWSYLFIGVGFLVIFIPETLYYYFNTKDLLFRIDLSKSWSGHLFWGDSAMLIKRLFLDFWHLTLFSFPMVGFLFWFVIIAVVYMFKKRLAGSYKIIAWIIGLFILYNFASLRLGSYRPMVFMWKGLPIAHRYLASFMMPAILIVAYFFRNIFEDKITNTKQKCPFFNYKIV